MSLTLNLKLSKTASAQLAAEGRSLFLALLKREGLPAPVWEYRFDTGVRDWRFDFAWVPQRVALEVDGAVWVAGRHTRGSGWLKDTEKLNAAAVQGWRLLRCTPDQLCTFGMTATIAAALTFCTE